MEVKYSFYTQKNQNNILTTQRKGEKTMVYFPIKEVEMTLTLCDKIDIKSDGQYIVIEVKTGLANIINSKSCVFCGYPIDLVHYKKGCICTQCIETLSNSKAGDVIY